MMQHSMWRSVNIYGRVQVNVQYELGLGTNMQRENMQISVSQEIISWAT